MSDWEDDDFGGFESADIGDVSAGEVTAGVSDTTDVPAPKETAVGNSEQADILGWILSNTPKSDPAAARLSVSGDSNSQLPTSTTETPSKHSLDIAADNKESPDSFTHGLELKDRLNDSAEIAKNLDDIFVNTVGVGSANTNINWSAEFSEAKKKIEKTVQTEPVIEKSVDHETLHKLQAELDAAILLKEQTEKSLEKVREDLHQSVEKRKQDLTENAAKHEEEIEKLKTQHKEELEELQKISEETVKQVSKQYSDILKLFEKEKSTELQSTANSITEKCLQLMKQQQEMLSQKLQEGRDAHEKEMKESLKEERENMKTNIENELEKGRKNLEVELEKILKEKMSEEAKKLQELHTSTLKEVMEKQQNHFEESLKSTLNEEREKFAELLKNSVTDAQANTEKAAEDRRKMEEKRIRNHTMAVKIFLSSALTQLEEYFPEQAERSRDDST